MSFAPASCARSASGGSSRSTREAALRTIRSSGVSVILAIVLSGTFVDQGAAAPPDAGVLVPGASLGGVSLGATKADVRRLWGRAYGRCRTCPRETLFFNRFAFRPEGAGVELLGGRVTAVFTIWAPAAWRTREGVAMGSTELRVTTTYPTATRTRCRGYEARVLAGSGAVSVVYLLDGVVWGFALLSRGTPICR